MTSRISIIEPDLYYDDRGDIWTLHRDNESICPVDFVEDKFSMSYQNTLRGFHGDDCTWKLMSCLSGACLFVAYDLETGETVRVRLDEYSRRAVLLAPGVVNAHLCLSDSCVMYYKNSVYYSGPENQISIRYDDPKINAGWPKNIQPILSDRDENAGYLSERK